MAEQQVDSGKQSSNRNDLAVGGTPKIAQVPQEETSPGSVVSSIISVTADRFLPFGQNDYKLVHDEIMDIKSCRTNMFTGTLGLIGAAAVGVLTVCQSGDTLLISEGQSGDTLLISGEIVGQTIPIYDLQFMIYDFFVAFCAFLWQRL